MAEVAVRKRISLGQTLTCNKSK